MFENREHPGLGNATLAGGASSMPKALDGDLAKIKAAVER